MTLRDEGGNRIHLFVPKPCVFPTDRRDGVRSDKNEIPGPEMETCQNRRDAGRPELSYLPCRGGCFRQHRDAKIVVSR